VGNSKVDFTSPSGNSYTNQLLPAVAFTSGSVSGMYDELGNTLFYTDNQYVYTNTGVVAFTLYMPSTNHEIIETCIVPVPGECEKYFIIYNTFSSGATDGVFYAIVDISGGLPVMISWGGVNLTCPTPMRASFAVGNIMNQSGERWLYTVAGTNRSNSNYCGAVNKHRITSTGIVYESTIMSGNNYPLEYTPLEAELSHDGTMLAWGGWFEEESIYVVSLNSSGNYSSHVDIDGLAVSAKSPGLEFSPDNLRLFFARLGDGIGYIDISNGFSVNVLCGPSCTYYNNHIGGFLELANDGLIYSAGFTDCISIDPITGVIGGKQLNLVPRSITLGHSYWLLPKQIDGFDLAQYRKDNLCCLHAHTFDDPQPMINYLSGTWTPTSNPFATQAVISLQNDLIIEPGIEVEIQDMTFMFGPKAKVIVKQGAKLILDNTIFTGIDECELMWPGVEVWGDPSKTQDNWNTNGLNSYQGLIIARSGSQINNALYAISAIPLDANGLYDASKAGGIIQVENSEFKNNNVGIMIGLYKNFQSNTNTRLTRRPNRSLIRDCDFITDDDFYRNMYSPHNVVLWLGSGIRIEGNSFLNTASVPWSVKGTGILSLHSPMTVTSLWSPNSTPNPGYIPNFFSGLLKGIDAYSFLPGNRIVITDCIFEQNYRAITLANATKPTITENLINLPPWDQVTGYPFGIYLSQCTDYHVEANEISGFDYPQTHGIIVHNSGPDDNEIYRNKFLNLNFGIKPQLINRGTINNLPTGLCLLCNEFSTSSDYYDIMVVAKSAWSGIPSGLAGIALNQKISVLGAISPPWHLPADNKFSNSHSAGTFDFDNSDADYLYYGHTNDIGLPSPIRYKPEWSTNIGFFYLPPDVVRCPSKLPPLRTLTQLYSDQNTAQVAVNSSRLLLDIWKDGGNIDLGEEVETTSSWDAYQQFNELMGMSPYISEEVLISMINNPVFTALMVKLVCVANPQSARNDGVLDALYNRTPSMPEEYIEDILSEWDTYSPLDELRANAGADYHMLRSIQSEIIGMYRTDSLLENNPVYYDSLVAFLSRMPGLTDRYELALTYLEFEDFEGMQNTLDSIPYSFELSEFENQEYLNHVISFGIAREIIEENLMPGQLSQTHISDLSGILEQGIGYSHEMALALLKWNDPAYMFEEIILDYVPQQQRKTKQSKKAVDPGLEVFPNPARDYCTVAFEIPENPEINATIVVTDISGREVYRSQPTQKSGEMLIDLKGLKSGFYTVSLISNETNLSAKRLVIVK